MTTTRIGWTAITTLAFALACATATPVQAQTGHDLMQQALVKEQAEGDLRAAIGLYERIAHEFAGERPLAARALVQMGRCYEKLGSREAERAYRRVIQDYPDRSAEVAEARSRLDRIQESLAALNRRPVFERIDIPTMPAAGVLSPDGRRLAFVSAGAVWTVPLRGNVASGLSGQPQRIASLDNAWDNAGQLAWSGDGRWIAVNGDSVVYVIPVEGGEPRIVPMPDRGSHAWAYRLSLSRDGGMLAYSALREGQVEGPNETEKRIIYTVPTTGGMRRPVADVWGRMPAFSPDGKNIAFVSSHQPAEGDWSSELWVAPAAGGHPSRVATSAPGRLRGPVWSPAGDRIAVNYEPRKNNFSQELWIIPLQGAAAAGPITRIRLPATSWNMPAGWTADGRIGVFTRTPFNGGAAYRVSAEGGKAGRLTPETGWPQFLKWSPDGQRLFFAWATNEGGDSIPTGPALLASTPAQGGAVSRVPLPWGREINMGAGFDISPDGEKVAFMGVRPVPLRPEPKDVAIWVAGVDGSGLTPLTDGPWYDAFPTWSPDGRWIAFVRLLSDDYDRANVYLVPAAGGEARRLTSDVDSGRVGHLAFSPDGSTLAFFSQRAIKGVPVNGGPARVLQQVETLGGFPELSWSPDGRRIAYVDDARGGKIRISSVQTGRSVELATGLPPQMRYTSAAWSPDGGEIAFIAVTPQRDEFWQISDFLETSVTPPPDNREKAAARRQP